MIARRSFLGAAAALAAVRGHAQKPARVAYLSNRTELADFDRAFVRRLAELGHVEGRNLVLDIRFTAGDAERVRASVEALLASTPDVIVATGPPGRIVARATATIPIVTILADPVGQGLAASLSRPGGNLTGITLQSTELARKRLQLLGEVVPQLKRVGVLGYRAEAPSAGRDASAVLAAEAAAAARPLGIAIVEGQVRRPGELAEAFARFRAERVQAAIVQVSPLIHDYRHTIFALAAEARLPAVYETRGYAEDGGLLSYGPDLGDIYRRLAGYVDRILRGARPGEIAIEQPGRFELVVNLRTAAELRLAIPQPVLLRADDVLR